jgi:hypothetical protein
MKDTLGHKRCLPAWGAPYLCSIQLNTYPNDKCSTHNYSKLYVEPDIRPDIQYPAFRLARYPVKSVSGASQAILLCLRISCNPTHYRYFTVYHD